MASSSTVLTGQLGGQVGRGCFSLLPKIRLIFSLSIAHFSFFFFYIIYNLMNSTHLTHDRLTFSQSRIKYVTASPYNTEIYDGSNGNRENRDAEDEQRIYL